MNKVNAGFEVAKYRHEFEAIILKIMREHTQRKGCEWEDDMDGILCDIATAIEKRERCKAAA